jgi:hypothetical protein
MSNNNQSGEHQNTNGQGAQERSSFSTGSTTQGGSNYGQGSSSLAGSSYSQGSEGGRGSNYDNEAGKLSNTSETDRGNKSSDIRNGGGAGGYDADREQQEVNKEREDMNSERDLDDLNVDKEQQRPEETNEDAQNPLKDR